MKLLLAGGAGHLGTLLTPYLRPHYELRVLDLQPPRDADVEYVEGSITDPLAVERALTGVDTFVTMVMHGPQDGDNTAQDPASIVDNYAVNTVGLHLLLHTAQRLGIRGGVHTSSASVHDRARDYFPAEEQVPLDSPSVYGLTKGFGEQVCAYFSRCFDMSLIALRLSGPSTREQYIAYRRNPTYRKNGHKFLYATDEEDLARAYLAALDLVQREHGRFEAVYITGDDTREEWNLAKARWLLGWQPESQRYLHE